MSLTLLRWWGRLVYTPEALPGLKRRGGLLSGGLSAGGGVKHSKVSVTHIKVQKVKLMRAARAREGRSLGVARKQPSQAEQSSSLGVSPRGRPARAGVVMSAFVFVPARVVTMLSVVSMER